MLKSLNITQFETDLINCIILLSKEKDLNILNSIYDLNIQDLIQPISKSVWTAKKFLPKAIDQTKL